MLNKLFGDIRSEMKCNPKNKNSYAKNTNVPKKVRNLIHTHLSNLEDKDKGLGDIVAISEYLASHGILYPWLSAESYYTIDDVEQDAPEVNVDLWRAWESLLLDSHHMNSSMFVRGRYPLHDGTSLHDPNRSVVIATIENPQYKAYQYVRGHFASLMNDFLMFYEVESHSESFRRRLSHTDTPTSLEDFKRRTLYDGDNSLEAVRLMKTLIADSDNLSEYFDKEAAKETLAELKNALLGENETLVSCLDVKVPSVPSWMIQREVSNKEGGRLPYCMTNFLGDKWGITQIAICNGAEDTKEKGWESLSLLTRGFKHRELFSALQMCEVFLSAFTAIVRLDIYFSSNTKCPPPIGNTIRALLGLGSLMSGTQIPSYMRRLTHKVMSQEWRHAPHIAYQRAMMPH